MARVELVFVPAPAIGHLVSTLEFAKRLIHYDHRLFITVLCMKFPLKSHLDAYIDSIVASLSLVHRIKLVHLPLVDSPPMELLKSIENFIYLYMESLVPHVRKALTDIVSSNSNYSQGDVVLVLDFFCMPMMDVANELGLPSYMFMTSNLGLLSLMFYLATRHNQISSELEESDAPLRLQGFQNPVPSSVLPTAAFCKDGGYSAYVKLAQRFRETKGIIVNSIEELESYSFSSMNDGAETPPIYMVGPVLDLNGQPHPSMDQVQNDKILKWLDEQPHSSVVFLCFGSMGRFGASQLREIASGLQRSGHRFLWSVRVQQPTTIDEILPEGFLEQIGSKGMICNEWAPQVKVLAHSAVGGFLSHCGWNSILESLWYGVPVATWPIYAEQQLNAFRMVREFSLAVDLRLDYKDRGDDHIVSAEEIETAVKHLMEGDSEVRKKVKEMSETARKSVEEGGSSFTAIGKLINSIIGSNYY